MWASTVWVVQWQLQLYSTWGKHTTRTVHFKDNVYSDCYNATRFNEQHLLTQEQMEGQKQTGRRKTKWIANNHLFTTTVLKALTQLSLSTSQDKIMFTYTTSNLPLYEHILSQSLMEGHNSLTRDFNTFKFSLGWWFKLMWLCHSLDKFLDYNTIINACVTRMQNSY